MLKKKIKTKQFGGYILLESSVALGLITFIIVTIVPLFVFINHQRELDSSKMEMARYLYEETELIRRSKPVIGEKKSGRFIMSMDYRKDEKGIMTLTVKGKDKQMVVISEGKN
ncbi:hypothetical protein OL233_04975 [Vagococcus sp. PNs007]|uniref:Competence protein ComGE n=1 Tax=Vagococcus proximus TaxID=2991417 RepID=A0ABT5X141_9ENTE|nr:hypothetical protein [Vagococcus proximus]MDF0479637.1 hypothetical protein [Vagococcus proximus]